MVGNIWSALLSSMMVDGDGEDVSVTAEDIYDIQRMVARRTVILCADGQEFPALLLNGEV